MVNLGVRRSQVSLTMVTTLHCSVFISKPKKNNSENLAKQLAVSCFIANASDPCKGAWSVINSSQRKETTFKCVPDEINEHFVLAVSHTPDWYVEAVSGNVLN